MSRRSEIKDSLNPLLACSIITVVLWFIPFASILVYPFRLFVTFIHELGHAIAAVLSFGGVNRIAMDWAGNGVTETMGGMTLLISSAGYLGTTIYGATMLLLLRRGAHARMAALFTGAVLLLATLFLGSGLVAWVAGMAFGLGLIALALKASVGTIRFAMSFLAIQSLLNAFYDLRVLTYISLFEPG